MNANLLTASLLNPTLAATAPWGAAGGAGEGSSGRAFSRALDDARQSSSPANEPARAPSPPPREPEGARRSETAGPSGSGQAEPSSSDRVQRGDSEGDGGRAARGAATTRPAEPGRRPAPQGASRRDTAGARADAPTSKVGSRGPDEGDDGSVRSAVARGHRAADTADADPAVAPGTDAGGVRPTLTGEAGDPTAARPHGSTARAAEGTGTTGHDPGGLGRRAAARGAAGVADTAMPESGSTSADRARAPASGARRASDEPAAAGALDVAALGLRAVPAEPGRAFAAVVAEGGRTGEGLGALGTGTAHPASATGAFAAALVAPTGTTASDAAGGVHEAGLKAAPGSEAFARELGTQVSVFVREGVQQARLHLNPQELGPVLVRIQLEGQTAQVHMAAEQQPTRQALEQALPALASQLSEAGITLTGGGVFERPPQGAEGREGRDEGARAPDFGADPADRPAGSAAAAAEPGRWSRPRGLVDLIA